MSDPPARTPSAPEDEPEGLPFVAPCQSLPVTAPLGWVRLGWQDLKRAPKQSLSYGLAMTALSWLIAFIALYFGSLTLFLGLLSGFIFVGPAFAIGLYSISCQLQLGRTPQLGYCLREGRRNIGNELVFAMILTVVCLVWARAASMVHIFFPSTANPELGDLIVFLGVGSVVGSLFAAIIFAASAFSLPMILDRKADMVTAVITSVNAVLRNKSAMGLWAGIIVGTLLVGIMTGFLAFPVLLPIIGHATWHAYRQTINASDWPSNISAPEART